MPASSCSRSSAYMRDRPSEAASRPGRLRREVEPRGVGAAHDRREPQQRLGREAELLDHHVEGAALAAMAPEHVLRCRRAWRRSARRRPAPPPARRTGTRRAGSTKRRISQGQAMRSIFGRARVTQTVRPCASRGGSLAAGTSGKPGLAQASKPAFEHSRPRRPHAAARRRRPALSFRPFWQMTTTGLPANSGAQSATVGEGPADEPGIRRGSAAKSSSVRTSIRRRAVAACRSGGRVSRWRWRWVTACVRPRDGGADAMLRHVASWGDRSPHAGITPPNSLSCQDRSTAIRRPDLAQACAWRVLRMARKADTASIGMGSA